MLRAYTQVDQAETEQERAFEVNAHGPALLAEASPKRLPYHSFFYGLCV